MGRGEIVAVICALIGAEATIVAAYIATRPRTPSPSPDTWSPASSPPSSPHDGVTRFWLQYWQCARSEFPALAMKQPGQVPAGSDWPQFRNPELGSGRRVVHKWHEGFADLEVQGAAGMLDWIRNANQPFLDPDMEVVRTSKSASIRIKVPRVDRFGDFQAQLPAVRTGLAAVARLLALSQKLQPVGPDLAP